MRNNLCSLPLLLLACWLGHPASVPAQNPEKPQEQAPAPLAVCPQPPGFGGLGVVFVANGAGGTEYLSENLQEALRLERSPFAMDVTHWTQGNGAIQDYQDVERHAEAAAAMAQKVMRFRDANPKARVILIGTSTGTHVTLLAAGMLPENSVDRIIVMAAAVSTTFDLRCALKASKNGIDNFWSPNDQILEMVEEVMGTVDRKRHIPTAGRVGFTPIPPKVPGAFLYRNLRQHKWDPDGCRFNNCGGHDGWTRIRFLRGYAVPLFMTSECPASSSATTPQPGRTEGQAVPEPGRTAKPGVD